MVKRQMNLIFTYEIYVHVPPQQKISFWTSPPLWKFQQASYISYKLFGWTEPFTHPLKIPIPSECGVYNTCIFRQTEEHNVVFLSWPKHCLIFSCSVNLATTTTIFIIQCIFPFHFIGWEPTMWPTNNCLQITAGLCIFFQCLAAQAFGYSKQLICSTLIKHDILLDLVQ